MKPTSPTPAQTGPRTVARAVLFDAYGTLFDVYSVALAAEQLFPGQGQALAVLWRDKQIEYSRLVTTSNDGAHYQPFWELTRAALIYAIKKIAGYAGDASAAADFDQRFGLAVERLMNQYRHLSAFPEVRQVLVALQAHGVPTGILSNADPAMLELAVKSAGLSDVLTHAISVDAVRRYKTHPAAYALGEQTLGLRAREIVFVSSNAWDALAATWYGYQTLWVNRQQAPFEELQTQPTHTASTLRAVFDFFPALAAHH